MTDRSGAGATRSGGRTPPARRWAVPAGLFLAAWALRAVFLFELRSSPLLSYPVLDMQWHWLWAKEILAGDWLGNEAFFRAPLYPYFLALVMAVAGSGFFGPRLLQAGVGSLMPPLLYGLARRMGLNPRAALAAGLVAAVYPLFLYYDTEFLIPVLNVALDVALLYSLAGLRPADGPRAWLAPGFWLGLSAIARPSILIFLPPLALWAWQRSGAGGVRAAGQRFGALLIGAGLVIAPVTIRNAVVGHDFVLIASQGGINFWTGNGALADGKTAMAAGPQIARGFYRDNVWLTSELGATRALGRRLKPSEVSDFWFKRGLAEISADPLRWLGLMGKKVYFLLNGTEIPSNQSLYYYREESRFFRALVWRGPLKLPFGLLLPLAAAGIYFSWPRRRDFSLLYFFLLAYGAGIVVFFINARFRLPLVPVLILFAAFAVQEWIGRPRAWGAAALFAGCLLVSNSNAFEVNMEDESKPYDAMGSYYFDRQEYGRAREMFLQALEKNPHSINALNNLGTLALTQGEAQTAADYYFQALLEAPEQPLIFNNLGLAYERLGRLEDAEEAFLKAFDLDPNYEAHLLNLNRIRQARGKPPLRITRQPKEQP